MNEADQSVSALYLKIKSESSAARASRGRPVIRTLYLLPMRKKYLTIKNCTVHVQLNISRCIHVNSRNGNDRSKVNVSVQFVHVDSSSS